VVVFRRFSRAMGGKFERPMWWVRARGMRVVMYVQVVRILEFLILLWRGLWDVVG
jgi:hypothetical protein